MFNGCHRLVVGMLSRKSMQRMDEGFGLLSTRRHLICYAGVPTSYPDGGNSDRIESEIVANHEMIEANAEEEDMRRTKRIKRNEQIKKNAANISSISLSSATLFPFFLS